MFFVYKKNDAQNLFLHVASESAGTLAEALKNYTGDAAFSRPIIPYGQSEIVRNYLLVPF